MTDEELEAIRARVADDVVLPTATTLAIIDALRAARANQDAAFRRGAAAMREAAAAHFECPAPFDFVAARIRALPDPENKS